MIVLDNVTSYYTKGSKKQYLLTDVTDTIPGNKNIAILSNDIHDSSLFLKLLSGLAIPNRGKIVTKKTFSWNPGLVNTLQTEVSVHKNVKFLGRLYGYDSYQIQQLCSYIKDFAELGNEFDLPLKSYTPEMKSRLTIGLLLVFESDYLVLDRIHVGNKSEFGKKVEKVLMDKLESGRSNVLVVTPAINGLKKYCDSAILLDSGKICFYDQIDEAIDVYKSVKEQHT